MQNDIEIEELYDFVVKVDDIYIYFLDNNIKVM